jgi:hypothetical protein
MASATALFGPWPDSSFVRRSLRPLPHHRRSGHWLQTWRLSSSSITSGGGRLRHQVVATGVAEYQKQTCLLAAPGYGEGREQHRIFTPTTALSHWRLRRWWILARWQRRQGNSCNFRMQRSSLPSVLSSTAMAFSQQLHNINS